MKGVETKRFLELGNFENARESTHQPHIGSTSPLREYFARINVLARSLSGGQGSSSHGSCTSTSPPHTKKMLFFPHLYLFRRQAKTCHFAGVPTCFRLRRLIADINLCISRGLHRGCEAWSYAYICCWGRPMESRSSRSKLRKFCATTAGGSYVCRCEGWGLWW